MDLDTAGLRAAVAVADLGSFSDAGLALRVSQQAVSKRIAKLEHQLGDRLFRRSRGAIVPTPAGAEFLVHARAAVASVDAAIAVTARSSTLRVAVHGSQIADANLMDFYLERHPGARIEVIVSSPSSTSRAAVLSGGVDAGFARAGWRGRPLSPGVRAMPAYLDVLSLLVGTSNPLSSLARVEARDLAGLTAWVPGAGFGSEVGDFYREFAERFGVVVDTDRSSGSIGFKSIVERVAGSSELVSFGGVGTTTPWHPGVVSIPIVNPTPGYPISLIWNDEVGDRSEFRALRAFVAGRREPRRSDIWMPTVDEEYFLGVD